MFSHFDATKVDAIAQKATRAMKAYQRDAMEAGDSAQLITSEIAATEKSVMQARTTMNEATRTVATAIRVHSHRPGRAVIVVHIRRE